MNQAGRKLISTAALGRSRDLDNTVLVSVCWWLTVSFWHPRRLYSASGPITQKREPLLLGAYY